MNNWNTLDKLPEDDKLVWVSTDKGEVRIGKSRRGIGWYTIGDKIFGKVNAWTEITNVPSVGVSETEALRDEIEALEARLHNRELQLKYLIDVSEIICWNTDIDDLLSSVFDNYETPEVVVPHEEREDE